MNENFCQKALSKGFLTFCLGAMLLAGLLVNGPQEALAKEPNIDAVVIRGASLGEGARGKKNGAILLTGAKEIARHVKLFLNNQQYSSHACGYNYEVELWSGETLVECFPYNIECGENFQRHTKAINSLLLKYDRQFRSRDVENLRYIRVSAAREPEELIQSMKNDGLRVFPARGKKYARNPSLSLGFTYHSDRGDSERIEADGKADAQRFLENWPQNLPKPVEYTPPSLLRGKSYQGKTEILLESIIRFPMDVDLQELAELAASLTGANRSVERVSRPEYYYLMLITPEKSNDELAKLLTKYGLPGKALR